MGTVSGVRTHLNVNYPPIGERRMIFQTGLLLQPIAATYIGKNKQHVGMFGHGGDCGVASKSFFLGLALISGELLSILALLRDS